MTQTLIRPLPQIHIMPAGENCREQVLMYVVRDTRGCDLKAADSMNRFPATPFCCITWMLEGESRLIEHQGKACDQRLPRMFISGCQSRHGVSMNIGERHSFMAVFFADAFHALFGLDLTVLQDQFVDATLLPGTDARQLLQAVAVADTHEARQELIETFISAQAGAKIHSPWSRLRKLRQRLSLQMAGILLGLGDRQVQRRVRREAGLPLLTLSRLWRAKRSHDALLEKLAQGDSLNWAEHALDQGFADQSHLVRDCKEVSGRSPQQLLDDVRKNESDWMYRLR
ncbi:helix-turn-helix domain-containing protein [Undibacterium sp. TJN19]|uniref:helix-turn-helix domain-containing protein n=1 Tax=Undibacterium sp. TJN19 TaxID=3413055 RepID=UPI003BEFA159